MCHGPGPAPKDTNCAETEGSIPLEAEAAEGVGGQWPVAQFPLRSSWRGGPRPLSATAVSSGEGQAGPKRSLVGCVDKV